MQLQGFPIDSHAFGWVTHMINTEKAPKYTATYLWLKYIYIKLKYNIDYMQALIQVSKELLNSGDWGVDELPVGIIENMHIPICKLYANYRDGVCICVCLHEAETHHWAYASQTHHCSVKSYKLLNNM